MRILYMRLNSSAEADGTEMRGISAVPAEVCGAAAPAWLGVWRCSIPLVRSWRSARRSSGNQRSIA